MRSQIAQHCRKKIHGENKRETPFLSSIMKNNVFHDRTPKASKTYNISTFLKTSGSHVKSLVTFFHLGTTMTCYCGNIG